MFGKVGLEAFEQWKKEQQHSGEWHSLPLIPVAAGGTLICDETDFKFRRDYGPDFYAVKVCGDSMKPLIEDGSILIMQATENLPGTHPKEGEIYDFGINGERTLKRFNIRKANPEYRV